MLISQTAGSVLWGQRSIPLTMSSAIQISVFLTSCPFRFSLEDEPSNLDEMPLMMSEEGFENDESDYQTLPRARRGQQRRGLGWFLLGGWEVFCTR